MKLVGFVPSVEAVGIVASWVQALAGEDDTIEYLCVDDASARAELDKHLGDSEITITKIDDEDIVSTVVKRCREIGAHLLVSSHFEIPDWPDQTSTKLLRAAPCQAVVGIGGHRTWQKTERPLLLASGGPHDGTLLELARNSTQPITLAEVYDDIGEEAKTVGKRALERLLRDANLPDSVNVETNVVIDSHPIRGALKAVTGHDLVLVGLDHIKVVQPLLRTLDNVTIAVVKRAPHLRRRRLPDWMPRINPDDYVQLVEDMRAGSRWGSDFVVMLATAVAIASLGLMQDSAAVVIGAMLIAPLMTPMIGLGLALAQASPRLAASCGGTILRGTILTLVVSATIGRLVPSGELLSVETLARGTPNVLDLLIALFAGVAASYALARPGIAAAIAGVAIATALVPPLCSSGIALSMGEWMVAFGALSLFTTNLLAIIIASWTTLSLMGVTPNRALPSHRRLARISIFALAGVLLLVSVPLSLTLSHRVDTGSVRPLGYPVKRSLAAKIAKRVDTEKDVQLMFMARSSTEDGVVIYVSSHRDLDRKLETDLTALVRDEMGDEDLRVLVVAVHSGWKD